MVWAAGLIALIAQSDQFNVVTADAAKAATRTCYAEQARLLDDHVSDAQTIAKAAVTACQTTNEAFITEMVRGHPEERDQMERNLQPAFVDVATTIVLQIRRQTRP